MGRRDTGGSRDSAGGVNEHVGSLHNCQGKQKTSTCGLSMRSLQCLHGNEMETALGDQQQQQQKQQQEEEEDVGAEGAMLWSLQEALERQTLQIGASACGATAVVDVLKALDIHVAPEDVERCVRTRQRRNEAPLPDYLLSRSQAGATHAQLISGADAASEGRVVGRFFHMFPARRVALLRWLCRWLRRGAVPVATMNMQRAVPEGEEVPDAWHHQLVFGVALDANAVFMTNPLDVERESDMLERLCSDSVLLVRRKDVLQRLSPDCSLSELSQDPDPRWTSLDVLGQVKRMAEEQEQVSPSHIVIPAAYKSGITLFALRHSPTGQELLDSPELPLL